MWAPEHLDTASQVENTKVENDGWCDIRLIAARKVPWPTFRRVSTEVEYIASSWGQFQVTCNLVKHVTCGAVRSTPAVLTKAGIYSAIEHKSPPAPNRNLLRDMDSLSFTSRITVFRYKAITLNMLFCKEPFSGAVLLLVLTCVSS